MTYEVRLAPQAVRDLRAIYIAKQVESSHHAETWFRGLEGAIFSLEELPHRSPLTPESSALRHLLYGNKPHIYRIIYTIDEASLRVNIAQIRHGARRPLPKSLG